MLIKQTSYIALLCAFGFISSFSFSCLARTLDCHNFTSFVGKLEAREKLLNETDKLNAQKRRKDMEALYKQNPRVLAQLYKIYLRGPQEDLKNKTEILSALQKQFNYSDDTYRQLTLSYKENPPYIYCPLNITQAEFSAYPVDIAILLNEGKLLNPDYIITDEEPTSIEIQPSDLHPFYYKLTDQGYTLNWNNDSPLFNDTQKQETALPLNSLENNDAELKEEAPKKQLKEKLGIKRLLIDPEIF